MTACNSFVLNGILYQESGEFTQVISNQSGCDSTITLNLTIESIDLSITQNENTLVCGESDAVYQWINCDTQQLIAEANAQSFEALENGDYAVIVTVGECSDTSDCVNVIVSNLSNLQENQALTVYPNPGKGFYQILDKNTTLNYPLMLEIFNVQGAKIQSKLMNKEEVNFYLDAASGLYFISFTDRSGNQFRSKLVHQQF